MPAATFDLTCLSDRGLPEQHFDAGETVFLEDDTGNLWPILNRDMAYDRATRYVQTNEVFKEGAYHGLLGAAAGSVIGAAVGIVTGEDMGRSIGKGAAWLVSQGLLPFRDFWEHHSPFLWVVLSPLIRILPETGGMEHTASVWLEHIRSGLYEFKGELTVTFKLTIRFLGDTSPVFEKTVTLRSL